MPTAGMTLRWDIPKTLAASPTSHFPSHQARRRTSNERWLAAAGVEGTWLQSHAAPAEQRCDELGDMSQTCRSSFCDGPVGSGGCQWSSPAPAIRAASDMTPIL